MPADRCRCPAPEWKGGPAGLPSCREGAARRRHSGFGQQWFVHRDQPISLCRPFAGVDISDWRQLLTVEGYDVSLAERTLDEFSAFSPVDTWNALAPSRPQRHLGGEQDAQREDHGKIRERIATSARNPSAAKTLFPGSVFPELSISSGAEAAKVIVKAATPAARLARCCATKYSPKISIILPIYDTPADYFREATQSIFAQTYTNWEMCVVDDGSRREETIIIRKELERSTDPRIMVVALPENRGIAKASQAALLIAAGDYVAFVDHDDLITPNALSEVVALLREDPTIDYVYTDHAMADRDGLPKSVSWKAEWSPEFLLSTNYIVHFKVVRRTLLLSTISREAISDTSMWRSPPGVAPLRKSIARIWPHSAPRSAQLSPDAVGTPSGTSRLIPTFQLD